MNTSTALSHPLAAGVETTTTAWSAPAAALLPPELIALLADCHRRFNPRRLELLQARQQRQSAYNTGGLPSYDSDQTEAVRGSWRVAPVPADLRVRRVEITGPINSIKMVINMLTRNAEGVRADTAMLDFEDSMKPSWRNVISGLQNAIGAADGSLSLITPEKTYRLNPDDMPVVMIRVRGLHLAETNLLIDGVPISGGLFDFVASFFHTARRLVARGKTPKFYIPKTEHHLEAKWWNDLFVAVQTALGLPIGTLRATFLIETLPGAFQLEEILYEFREHAAGLNVGRWDKIFSDIKVLRRHPDRIMADRATITMGKPWMDNYAKRLIKTCHERGAYAIGGMSAFTPGRTAELREKQMAKVMADKANEFAIGHDGCWVSHPFFIGPALGQFKREHQIDRLLPEFPRYPDILPRGESPHTIEGLRINVRVGIAYQNGWNQDIGCVSWDNLMEDLATLEISRSQTWQWLHHRITLDDGRQVTPELLRSLFVEELTKILAEVETEMAKASPAARNSIAAGFRRAADDALSAYLQPELSDFLSLASAPAPAGWADAPLGT